VRRGNGLDGAALRTGFVPGMVKQGRQWSWTATPAGTVLVDRVRPGVRTIMDLAGCIAREIEFPRHLRDRSRDVQS